MKKITVKSDKHDTTVSFYVPEVIKDSHVAMEWMAAEATTEKKKNGRFGPARKRELENKRKLCQVEGMAKCGCFVKYEKF